jgi:hypothetical protein
VTDPPYREFLQGWDGTFIRVVTVGNELVSCGEPPRHTRQHAPDRKIGDITAFGSRVVADAPECHLCTWVPLGGRWALKFANRQCMQHRLPHDGRRDA